MNLTYKNILSLLFITALFVGCSKETTDKSKTEVATSSSPQKIEIVANDHAQEIKVKVKESNNSKSNSYYYDYNIKREYDPNAKPANKDAAVRVKPRTTVDANIHIRSPYEKVQISLLVKKLSKKFIVKCSACHDDYANGIIGPSLLSRDSDYIYNKISQFKSGEKSNPLMDGLIKQMTDDEIKAIADEIYQFNIQIKQLREKK